MGGIQCGGGAAARCEGLEGAGCQWPSGTGCTSPGRQSSEAHRPVRSATRGSLAVLGMSRGAEHVLDLLWLSRPVSLSGGEDVAGDGRSAGTQPCVGPAALSGRRLPLLFQGRQDRWAAPPRAGGRRGRVGAGLLQVRVARGGGPALGRKLSFTFASVELAVGASGVFLLFLKCI